MKTRLLTPLLVLALILVLVPVKYAEGAEAAPECFNLSADDCALLLTAVAKTNTNISSFHQKFRVELALRGWLGQAGGDANDFTFSAEGEGLFSSDPAAALQNPFAATSMALDMETKSVNGKQIFSVPLSIRYVDATSYWTDPLTGQWMGLSIEDAMTLGMLAMNMVTQMSQAPMVMAPMGQPHGGMGAVALPPSVVNLLSSGGDLTSLGLGLMSLGMTVAVPAPAMVVNYERLDDVDMMGQSLAPFRLEMDLAPLLSSDQFRDSLAQALMAAGESTQDPNLLIVGQLVPEVLKNSSIKLSMTQWVGTEDQYVHKLAIDVETAVDLNALGLGAGAEPATASLHFEVTLDQINQGVNITPPKNAVPINPSIFSAMLSF